MSSKGNLTTSDLLRNPETLMAPEDRLPEEPRDNSKTDSSRGIKDEAREAREPAVAEEERGPEEDVKPLLKADSRNSDLAPMKTKLSQTSGTTDDVHRTDKGGKLQ